MRKGTVTHVPRCVRSHQNASKFVGLSVLYRVERVKEREREKREEEQGKKEKKEREDRKRNRKRKRERR